MEEGGLGTERRRQTRGGEGGRRRIRGGKGGRRRTRGVEAD